MGKIIFTPYIKNNKGVWVPEKVGVDPAVFTGMQENAVATICEASFKRNVVFPNVHSIVSRVSSVRRKLQGIFSSNNIFNTVRSKIVSIGPSTNHYCCKFLHSSKC